MNRLQSLGGGARGFLPLKAKKINLLQKVKNIVIINNILGENEVYMKKGFTLAEVLITLGIIGVVAAITMPVITKSYRKQVIETSLQKFYTNMNQALKLSSLKHGEYSEWEFPNDSTSVEQLRDWYNTYLKDYLKTVKNTDGAYRNNGSAVYNVYFADGTVVGININGHDYYFCLNAKALDEYVASGESKGRGSKCFVFGFYPSKTAYSAKPCVRENYVGKGIEPYINYENTDCSLKDYYKLSPSKTIQMNGWKIPDNYALKY